MLKITIITATYNSEATLRDTMDSILRQTWQGYEYIVIDGASTDGTLDIIKEYEPKFEGKMRYISEPDRGIYDAMNKGFAMATGNVIGILNSDDFYTSVDVLQTIAGNFLLGEMDAVYADIHYVKNDDVTKTVRYYSSAIFRRPLMRFGLMPAHPSFYCSRAVYEKSHLYPPHQDQVYQERLCDDASGRSLYGRHPQSADDNERTSSGFAGSWSPLQHLPAQPPLFLQTPRIR